MNKKKSFLMYADLKFTIDKLPDESAGKLFKLILNYVNGDYNPPDDLLLQVVFEPIKQSLIRDLEMYEAKVIRNKENGAKGGRPTKDSNDKPKKPSGLLINPSDANGLLDNQHEAKKADSDNGSDNDSDNESDILNIAKAIAVEDKKKPTKKERFDYKSKIFFKDDKANKLIIEFFDHLVEKKRSPTERSAKMIMNILREAESLEQIIHSIQKAIAGQFYTIYLQPSNNSSSNLSFEKNKNGLPAASPNTFSRASNGLQIK
jgi:hypothetical protein